jgi:hypothetical protein
MESGWTECYWCESPIAKTHPALRWIDDYESATCEFHPYAWDILANKTTHQEAPHQTMSEVYSIIKKEHEGRVLLRKRQPLKAVEDNVVMLAKKPRETSRRAAANIFPRTGTLRRQVHDLVFSSGSGGSIDEELEIRMNGKHQSISAIRRSLVIDGYLVDSGRTRKNSIGNECIVWVHRDEKFTETLFHHV